MLLIVWDKNKTQAIFEFFKLLVDSGEFSIEFLIVQPGNVAKKIFVFWSSSQLTFSLALLLGNDNFFAKLKLTSVIFVAYDYVSYQIKKQFWNFQKSQTCQAWLEEDKIWNKGFYLDWLRILQINIRFVSRPPILPGSRSAQGHQKVSLQTFEKSDIQPSFC